MSTINIVVVVVALEDPSMMAAKLERNPGVSFDASWIENVRINYACTKLRGETLGTRRSIKKEWQAAWLLRAITCMDLTTLAGLKFYIICCTCFCNNALLWLELNVQGSKGSS